MLSNNSGNKNNNNLGLLLNESKIDYYKARQIFSKEQQAEEYLNLFKKVIR